MQTIKELIELTPIITEENIKEFLRQNSILECKSNNVKPIKNAIKRKVDYDYNENVLDTNTNGFCSFYIDNRIIINLKNLRKNSFNNEEIFLKKICAAIIHETLHKVLQLNENEKASLQFDNIYYKYEGYGITTKEFNPKV